VTLSRRLRAGAERYGAYARGILFRWTYPKLEEVELRVGELLPSLGWRRIVSPRTRSVGSARRYRRRKFSDSPYA
jgi:hypothetical protein